MCGASIAEGSLALLECPERLRGQLPCRSEHRTLKAATASRSMLQSKKFIADSLRVGMSKDGREQVVYRRDIAQQIQAFQLEHPCEIGRVAACCSNSAI